MDLFHFREESQGSVLWHEKGWNLVQKLMLYMRATHDDEGNKESNRREILNR